MPIVLRMSGRSPDPTGQSDEAVAEYIDPMPEWRTRALTTDEVSNVTDLVITFLQKSGFTWQHIAQVFSAASSSNDPEAIRSRFRRMKDDFAQNGFKLGIIP